MLPRKPTLKRNASYRFVPNNGDNWGISIQTLVKHVGFSKTLSEYWVCEDGYVHGFNPKNWKLVRDVKKDEDLNEPF